MKFGVVVFPGSNCDRDVQWVTEGLLGQPTRLVWHQERNLDDLDAIILPGGFSYGDYLRCGAIARFSPAMEGVREAAAAGKPVLGICNGFQILTESGLLPGALVRNRDLHFICDQVPLCVERVDLPWTRDYELGQTVTLPIAHGEGRYHADPDLLKELEDNGQIVFRYAEDSQASHDLYDPSIRDVSIRHSHREKNPNGSVGAIAGICNRQGNVLGMMPHPERAADRAIGSTEGLAMFEALLAS